MQKDGVATSKYGHTVAGKDKTVDGGAPYADDFAETLLLYGRVKGTPEEAKMRALFPGAIQGARLDVNRRSPGR